MVTNYFDSVVFQQVSGLYIPRAVSIWRMVRQMIAARPRFTGHSAA
jgi:hypothetical protein